MLSGTSYINTTTANFKNSAIPYRGKMFLLAELASSVCSTQTNIKGILCVFLNTEIIHWMSQVTYLRCLQPGRGT
ncbi:hypothetical protein ALT1644_40035 [Alteromonas macleodii]